MTKSHVLARERRWSTRAGLAAIVGALLALAGFFLLQSAIGGGTNFEGLESIHDHNGEVWLSAAASAIGFALLTVPLYFLFRAAQARSPRMRNQFIGVVLLGPLLLAISAPLLAGGTQEAADNYAAGSAKSTLTAKEASGECESERKDKGAKSFGEDFEASGGSDSLAVCEAQKQTEDLASNAIRDASLVSVGQFTGLAGAFGMLAALFYSCLWAMRSGLLTRFWGSLGMAVGVAALIGFSPILLIWFLYFGVLLLGRLPKGKPPAWEAGEAIPWPTTGQKVASEIEPKDADVIDVDAIEDQPVEAPEPTNGNGSGGDGPRRKRKRRS